MSNQVPKTALFVCFGGMSNVGIMSGLATLEAVQQLPAGQAGIFCLGGLPTGAPTVLAKTRAVDHIITVDGCPLNCAKKIVEQAGFSPYNTVTLTEDCGITKGPADRRNDQDLQTAIQKIKQVVLESA